RHLLLQEFAFRLRILNEQGDLQVFLQLLGDGRIAQAVGERGAEFLDDRLRRVGGREHAPPGVGLEAWEAGLDRRLCVGKRCDASFAGLQQRPQPLAVDLWRHQCGATDDQIDMARDGISNRRTAAAVGHVHHGHARALAQQRHGEVTDAAGADGGVHSTFGAVPISSTGSRSFSVLNERSCRNGLTAWVSNTNTQLLPSGLAFATAAVPTLPEAPGRFSMMMVAPPSFSCMRGCTSRAIGSTLPPGGNGTMILMTPDGQVCACAAKGAASGAAMPPSTTVRREIFM